MVTEHYSATEIKYNNCVVLAALVNKLSGPLIADMLSTVQVVCNNYIHLAFSVAGPIGLDRRAAARPPRHIPAF